MKSSLYFTVIMVLAVSALSGRVLAQNSWNMELVGKTAYDGSLRNYEVYGDYLFVATFNIHPNRSIFTVVDISDPQHPERVGVIDEYPTIADFLVVDTLLYLSIWPTEVVIFDIHDPSSPVELIRIDEDRGFGYDLRVFNSYVFSMFERRLPIVDISDRLDPVIISSIETGIRILTDYAFFGNYLILTENYNNLPISFIEIYDISSIEDPVLIYSTQLDVMESQLKVEVIGNYAYLYNSESGIMIYDLANIDEPAFVGTAFDTIRITDVVIYGQFLFAATASGAILTIDISDPLNPMIINGDFNPGASRMLQLRGTSLYYTVSWSVIGFLSIINPDSPQLEGMYFTGPADSGPATWAGYLYYGIDYAGLRIVDISNPASPIAKNYRRHGGASHYSFVKDGLLYFTDHYDSVFVYSLADPANPEFLSTVLTGSLVHRIDVSNEFLYISCDGDGFRIVDVSEPQDPVEVLHYPSPNSHNGYRAIVGNGDYVYTAESDSGIGIYYVADPLNPVKVSAYREVSFPWSLFYENDILYVADGSGLLLLDVSDPESPDLISVASDYAWDVVVKNQLAYAASFDNGLKVFDVSDPNNPIQVGAYEDVGLCSDVYVANDTVYVTAGYGGLWILRYDETLDIEEDSSVPEKADWITIYPNPFNPRTSIRYSLPEQGDITLSIYNLLGQRVAILFEGTQQAGNHSITWDASAFPSGVYFARLEAGGRWETVKMVLLR